MVTRTIISTKITALVVLLDDGVTEVRTFTLPREHKDAGEVLKYCRKFIDNDSMSVVKVLEMEVEEKLYGMSEQQFLELAKIIEKPTKE